MMSKGEVNPELLFGLVALQNGFIDQSGLVTAFHGWERDKSQSLAAYLVARGDLDQDRKSAIDALVAEHRQDDGRKLEALGGGNAGPPRLPAVRARAEP